MYFAFHLLLFHYQDYFYHYSKARSLLLLIIIYTHEFASLEAGETKLTVCTTFAPRPLDCFCFINPQNGPITSLTFCDPV